MRAAVLLTLSLLVAPASARPVDWSAGSVSVTAVGVADLRLPSVAIARIAAERAAGAQAAARLREAVRALPLAGGGTVAKTVDGDGELAGALDALLGGVKPELDYQSDGSVVARASLPLARVSALLAREAAPEDDAGATTIVVDARKAKIAPAVGYRVEAGKTVRWAPFYFVAGADDARARAPHVEARATSVKKGVVGLALEERALAEPPALVVLVVNGETR